MFRLICNPRRSAQWSSLDRTWASPDNRRKWSDAVDRVIHRLLFGGRLVPAYGRVPVYAERLEVRSLLSANLLDSTFSGDGIVTTNLVEGYELATAITATSDGKSLVAGIVQTSAPGNFRDFALARYNANGTLDPTFGGGDGFVTTGVGTKDDFAYAMALLPSGKVLVAGTANVGTAALPNYDFALVRFNANGTLDTTFGGDDGKVTTPVTNGADDIGRAILVMPDGDIVVGGNSQITSADNVVTSQFAVVRYNSNGTLDAAFGGGAGKVVTDIPSYAADQVSAISAGPGGTFYLAGAADSTGVLARYHSNGALDSTFGGDGIVEVSGGFSNNFANVGLARLPDGRLVMSGSYAGLITLAKFNSDGSPDTTFGFGGQSFVGAADGSGSGLAVLPSGKLIVNAGSIVARILPNGFADSTLDGEDGVYFPPVFDRIGYTDVAIDALALAPDGKVLIAGAITQYSGILDGENQFGVIRLKNLQIEVPEDMNDQIAEAVPLSVGVSKSDTISSGIDVDMYKINVAAGQWLDFDLDRPAGGKLDSIVRLFNHYGEEFATNDDAAAPGEAAGTTDSYLRYFFREDEVIFVGVSGSANGSYNAVNGRNDVAGTSGGYMLRVTNVPVPVDPDDQLPEASAISVADPARSGTISNPMDVDLVKFTVVAGQRIGIDIDLDASSTLDPVLKFFNADGTEITTSFDGPAPGEPYTLESYIDYTFPLAGTYYAGVSGYGNHSYNPVTGGGDYPGRVGNYKLDLVNIPGDPDDQISEASTITPGTRSGTISNATDVDMYKFAVTAGQFIQLDINTKPTGTLDSFIHLFDDQGVELDYSDDDSSPGETSSNDSYVEFIAPSTGFYYVGISGSGNYAYEPLTGTNDSEGAKGDYQLKLTISPKAPNADPDDQVSEAVSVTKTATGGINPLRDVDMYAVKVVEGEPVTFRVDSASIDTVAQLFNSAGEQLAYGGYWIIDNDSYYQQPNFSYTFDAAGTYYIGISGDGNQDYSPLTGLGDHSTYVTGTYQLTVDRPVPDLNDQIAEATGVTAAFEQNGAIDPSGDVDMYAVHGLAGQEWVLGVTTPTSNLPAAIRVFQADGTEVTSNSVEDPGLRIKFDAAGTYYLGVSSNANTGYNAVTGLDDNPDTSNPVGTYHVSIRPVAADQNDQISEATPLTKGVKQSGTIASATDVNLYSFNALAGQAIAIDLDRPAGGIDSALLRLFDAAGVQIDANQGRPAPDELPNNESYLEFIPTVGGTYYVGVSTTQNSDYLPLTGKMDRGPGPIGAYQITVSGILDPDDTLSEASAMAINGTRSGTIATISDVDVFKFTVSTGGQRIGLDLDLPAGSGLDSYLRLFDSSGQELVASDDTPAPGEPISAESYLEYLFTKPGVYYVGVSSHANSSYNPLNGLGKGGGHTFGTYVLRAKLLS